MSKPVIVFYHANCTDGFASAWVMFQAENRLPGPIEKMWACNYADDLSNIDIAGKHVYFVDFSASPDVLRSMAAKAASVTVIDHHKKAKEALDADPVEGLRFVFDNDHSGAWLTWNYCMEEPAPKLIQYIEDRDLWRWKLPQSRPINAVIQATDYSFEDYTHLAGEMEHNLEEIVSSGELLLKAEFKRVMMVVKTAVICYHGKWTLVFFNGPKADMSKTCHLALQEYPEADFAMGYYVDHNKQQSVVSLRSRVGSDVDVNEIAKQYGGGGHKHAAGFTIRDDVTAVFLDMKRRDSQRN